MQRSCRAKMSFRPHSKCRSTSQHNGGYIIGDTWEPSEVRESAAGQIGYSLLPRIASGGLFGPGQPIELRLIEIAPALKHLEGVMMELQDCAFPLVHDVSASSDLAEGFRGVNWALLVESVPRKAGMERKELLGINGKTATNPGGLPRGSF